MNWPSTRSVLRRIIEHRAKYVNFQPFVRASPLAELSTSGLLVSWEGKTFMPTRCVVSENGGACTLTLGTIHCLFQIIDRGQATLSRISSGAHSAGKCSRGDTFLLFPANFSTVPSAQNRALVTNSQSPKQPDEPFQRMQSKSRRERTILAQDPQHFQLFPFVSRLWVFFVFFANYWDSQQLT